MPDIPASLAPQPADDAQTLTVKHWLTNALYHWKTTAAGLVLCVMQIATQLDLPGPHNHTAIVLAVGTALLGALSKDPASSRPH